MKSEKGITLIALLLTVLLMIILAGAAITYGGNSAKEVELQNFSYALQQIQGKVDTIYEKMSMDKNSTYTALDGKNMGVSVVLSDEAHKTLKKITGYDYYASGSSSNPDLYHNGNGTDAYYRYFSKSDLDRILDIKNSKIDVIINFKTREVISVKGQVREERTYYHLVNGTLR